MRAKVAEGHPNPTDLFDLKHDRGGMVDIEFTVQYLVLLHSGAHPELTRNAGNIALLRMAGVLNLIDAGLALAVGDAYRLFRARQHIRLGWLTPLTGLLLMTDLVSFWSNAWEMRSVIPAGFGALVFAAAIASVYYLAASLVFPRSRPTGPTSTTGTCFAGAK